MRTISELANLKDRVALITGGAGHIALAASESLLELAADVVILDLDPDACEKRVDMLSRVHAMTFDSNLENLVSSAIGVIGMGGYNTFCEILSFDKPSLIVPRTVPRLEQYIRASRAEELGLVTVLVDDGHRDPQRMAAAIRGLPSKPKPSETRIPGLLDGLSTINGSIDQWLNQPRRPRVPLKLVQHEI